MSRLLDSSINGGFPKKKPSYLIKSKYIKHIHCPLRNYPPFLHITEKEAKHILLIIFWTLYYIATSQKCYFFFLSVRTTCILLQQKGFLLQTIGLSL